MKTLKTIKLKAATGKETIAKASELFTGWIDSDFKNWNLDFTGEKTKAMELTVCEMTEDQTFAQMFPNPEKMTLTQSQIIEFVKNHKDLLHPDGWATFFLFKVGTEFFVARVHVYDDGQLYAHVHRLSFDYVWLAESRYRFVMPVLVDNVDNKEVLIRTRDVWRKMKHRCENPKNQRYQNYGGRGINYCEKWKTFDGFLEDMGEQPEDLSLDRIDNDGNYEKSNCRWATSKKQFTNRSDTVLYNGECAKDASLRLGGGMNLVNQRIRSGWSKEEAFTTPVENLALESSGSDSLNLDSSDTLPPVLVINGVAYGIIK